MRAMKVCLLLVVVAGTAEAANLRVLRTGLGSGTVTSMPAGINCGATCSANLTGPVTLTASAPGGSTFAGWSGDCSGSAATCMVTVTSDLSVRAEFALSAPIPTIADFTPAGLQTYLTANPSVNTPARFLKALPSEFKENWILMSRSESLQTGTAEAPRLLLPNVDARFTFTVGMMQHASYPGSHPNAIEYMQWDAATKNFRFHEIVLDFIPIMGSTPARNRGVSADDARCSKCHSTRNVLNRGTTAGTTGIPPGTVKEKNKPNWDSYDSWAGMLPFNRDRIYQGTVEAAAFRKVFNLWTWSANPAVRAIIEQLQLQPSGIPANHQITRTNGGPNDGHINFAFDLSPPVLVEPAPVGTSTSTIAYSFDGLPGTGGTTVQRGGDFLTLHHSAIATSDEGRGVHYFDLLGGLYGSLNQTRVGDEVASHRFATGSVPVDPRPMALAINKGCVSINAMTDTVVPAIAGYAGFFTPRNGGLTINQVVADTRTREQNLTLRKADIQAINLDRTNDVYLFHPPAGVGLIQQYGASTSQGTTTAIPRIRQEVFRRPLETFPGDSTVMGGFYVDREKYIENTDSMALYRYFLEPLGISVDRWSMGVRGRGRTYTFADIFNSYTTAIRTELELNLAADPIGGLPPPYDCGPLITAANNAFAALPPASAVPPFTDVQRIFNKGCIECHGGLAYPPFDQFFPATYLDLSENENPPAGQTRLSRSHGYATGFTTTNPATSLLYIRMIDTSEACPYGMMPCGGPAMSKVDLETIRRWIVGGRPSTSGDPHLTTVDGVHYDFQAAGEFVLLRGENLEIQARHSAVQTETPLGPNGHTGLTSCVSINTAAAVRVGTHRITYEPNLAGEPSPNGLELRVDGKGMRVDPGGIILARGGRILPTNVPGGIQIEVPGGTDVVITPGWWAYYSVWYLNIDVRHARAVDGLIGAIAPGNWLPALPDGMWLGPRPASLSDRYDMIYNKFGDSWRVTNASTLFDYAPGMSTKSFTVASWPGFEPKQCLAAPLPGMPNRTPPKRLEVETAAKLCGEVKEKRRRADCIADVMVTGEPGFAETQLRTERIQLNQMPEPPALLFPPNNAVNVGGGELRIGFAGTRDFEDERLTYLQCVWEAGEPFTYNFCKPLAQEGAEKMTASFGNLKPGKAYFWKVIVQDGNNGIVESETRRFATTKK